MNFVRSLALSRFYRDNEVFVEFRAEFESPITIMPQIGRQSIDDQSVRADFKYTLAIMRFAQ